MATAVLNLDLRYSGNRRFGFLSSKVAYVRTFLSAVFIICLASAELSAQTSHQSWRNQFDAFDYARRLGQAVNLGNALEAPREGDWGLRLAPWHFESIAEGGFDAVRVPIRWSAHADNDAPYDVDEQFFDRIDWVIEQAKQNDLAAIINIHHYDEFYSDVDGHKDRFLSIWNQVATRYQDEPKQDVYFELLNEPNNAFTHSTWRSTAEDAIETIRQTNPDRMLIVGGINFNSVADLGRLRLPEEDRNLIGTFHYYDPFPFTHQGAEWVNDSARYLGTTWEGSDEQKADVERSFDIATNWSERFDRPVFLGEFGAYSRADMDSRARWTDFVAQVAEERGFAWSYWEYGAGFGVIDRSTREWIDPLYDALSPKSILDIDGRDGVDNKDLDLLSQFLALGSTESVFDVDGSGAVDQRDLDFWVYFTRNRIGDADLDGAIGFRDIVVLRENFGQRGSWSDGDFDANGIVDFLDFLLLARHWSDDERLVASVPEPSLAVGLPVFLACIVLRKRRPAIRLA